MVRLAVWGCGHGTLDRAYAAVAALEASAGFSGPPVDALLCCGDFQAVRSEADMESMACPQRFRAMQDFAAYYAGRKRAPLLTLFVGGNHEAGVHLAELPLGGWVAPNIYYLGSAGAVRLRGLRIAGLSGIFKRYDYRRGCEDARAGCSAARCRGARPPQSVHAPIRALPARSF